MQYTQSYLSPLGRLLLASDGDALTGLWFEGQKYFGLDPAHEEMDLPVFDEAKRWLALYFGGTEPDFTPKLSMMAFFAAIMHWFTPSFSVQQRFSIGFLSLM